MSGKNTAGEALDTIPNGDTKKESAGNTSETPPNEKARNINAEQVFIN